VLKHKAEALTNNEQAAVRQFNSSNENDAQKQQLKLHKGMFWMGYSLQLEVK
jgi:hypothetical protein